MTFQKTLEWRRVGSLGGPQSLGHSQEAAGQGTHFAGLWSGRPQGGEQQRPVETSSPGKIEAQYPYPAVAQCWATLGQSRRLSGLYLSLCHVALDGHAGEINGQ